MTPLVLIRHGATDWNADGRIQGRSDPPLSAAGRRAVAAWRLPEEMTGPGAEDWTWLTSPLERAPPPPCCGPSRPPGPSRR